MSKVILVVLVAFLGVVTAAIVDWDAVDDEPFLFKRRPESVNIRRCLAAHNEYRRRHGAPPLIWDTELANDAQNYANKLAAEHAFRHDQKELTVKNEGENLASSMGAKLDCAGATKLWYDEVKDYDFSHPGFNHKTGHFTQVVWKATKRVGVGISSSGKEYRVVARYSPPGNYFGQFAENVER
ncbi:ectin [Exaiptasia diaphana]|uniref:SCP domain-containing protein n=1 Tax=Exaiptasia diaphana TaxID=2652724 RepID=A0A913XXE3_EXADI|nr:ectin [Exaiptasia diaphana]KXJ08635.1 Golgi-associated plant pathogenesis-related protein 1 [Exaiptasia diaphana]